MKKRILIGITSIIAVVVIVGGFFGFRREKPAKPEPEKITLGISSSSLLSSLIYIAARKDYFQNEGIDIEIKKYATGKSALADVLKGKIDICTVADTPIVSNSFKRNDFALFATIVDSAKHAKVLARKDRGINNPQDLIGKRLATTLGTSAHFYMFTFFIMNSLDLKDVKIINMKPKQMAEAIISGDIDAAFTWEPNILNAGKILGDKAIAMSGNVEYLATFNLVSMKAFIKDNPEILKKILKALIKAEEFAEDNPEESVNIVASYMGIDRENIKKLWNDYKYRVSLPQFLLITLEDEARWYIESGQTDKTEVPNYLNYIYIDALVEVKPDAVTIIR